jgi:hypothetical protein
MKKRFLVLLLIILFATSYSYSQFYKVYGYKTRAKNEAEIVLWNTYIAQSDLQYSFFGKEVDRQGLWAHSAEIEYGITDRLTVALYLDFEDPAGENLKHFRTRAVFFRYRFAEKGKLFFDPAIYVEYYIPKKDYKDYEELEVRLILEKDLGDFRFILNPMFEKKTSGSKVSEGVELNYAMGVYYRKYSNIQPGIEFHGKMGEMSDFKPWEEQRQVIFPTVDFRFGPGFHWHLGAGIGLTDGSDSVILKSIFSYKF